jgi:tRNA pseudouridine55 synthase
MNTATANGLLVLDKPGGITSRDAVNRLQRWFPRGTRIGHAGTLDPLATGILVLGIGPATRLVEYIQRMEKEYRTDLVLGATSTTDDADGAVSPLGGVMPPTRTQLVEALQSFLGTIEQRPPAFSAAKVAGRRAHDMARRGEKVVLQPRSVQIYAIELLCFDYLEATLHIRCGKGTYIRSLARDLGARLGCGAYVRTLRRTRIGPFTLDRAWWPAAGEKQEPVPPLLPPREAVCDLPVVNVRPAEMERLRHGQTIRCPAGISVSSSAEAMEVAVFAREQFVGVGEINRAKHTLAPVKMLPPD